MIIDNIKNIEQYLSINKRLGKALHYIATTDFSKFESGKHDITEDSMFLLVNDYQTKENELNIMEAHRKYIDLQYIYKGSELIEHEILNNQKVYKEYDSDNDYILFTPNSKTEINFSEGMFAIFYPNDLHMPGLIKNKSELVRKIVVKVLID